MSHAHLQKFKDVPKKLKRRVARVLSTVITYLSLKHAHTSQWPLGFREAERKLEDIKKKRLPMTGPKMKTVLDGSLLFPM